ncbi:hypothetical protein [Terriglobus aquaticus]|uniref:Pentapeptide MXKDX repeat protein n=1 Tax=Terriglobus aquaticus TaxID=940139 RepID=A0ABW9KP02_9BACT|nr:hypothetical protein [Terriglobus aquaticus]
MRMIQGLAVVSLLVGMSAPVVAQMASQDTAASRDQLKADSHASKKASKADKEQAKADKKQRKALGTHEQKEADKAQDKADKKAAEVPQ